MKVRARRSSCCTASRTPAMSGATRCRHSSSTAFARSCPTCAGVAAAASPRPLPTIVCRRSFGMSPASLTPCASSGRTSSATTGAQRWPTLEAFQKGWYRLLFLFEGVAEEVIQRDDWYLFRLFLAGAQDTDAYVKTLSEPGALTPALNWYRANLPVQALFGRSGGPQLPMVKADTLGIWSSGDLYLTEEAMTRSAQRVQGSWRYERFDGSHWVPLDQPDRLNRLLLDFLS